MITDAVQHQLSYSQSPKRRPSSTSGKVTDKLTQMRWGEGGGGLSLGPLILITWLQAVRQMRYVGKGGGGGGGEGGDLQQITAPSNSYLSFFLSFCPLCILRGFDKNFTRSSAEQVHTR
jgi:hypothetical protein